MKHDKGPGSDGYTAEFFKFFFGGFRWSYGPLYQSWIPQWGNVNNTKARENNLYPERRKRISFLVFFNWRPITLLNTLHEIASLYIARRLKTVLPQLMHEDQTGF